MNEKTFIGNVKGPPGPEGPSGPQGNPGDISQIGGIEEIAEIIADHLTDMPDLALIFENNLT